MDKEEMEEKIKTLEKQVSTLYDLEEIKRLQKSYGYYLEHWMYEELIELFSDSPDTTLSLMSGIYLGKEGVRRYFSGTAAASSYNPEFLHQIMQLSGIVDINTDGKTARGRWYGFGAIALPRNEGIRQIFTGGIYTSEYVKEDNKWKILKITWNPIYTAPPGEGWVKPERIATSAVTRTSESRKPPKADKAREFDTRYPSGYIVPFHFVHPVTGKESTEKKRNEPLNFTQLSD